MLESASISARKRKHLSQSRLSGIVFGYLNIPAVFHRTLIHYLRNTTNPSTVAKQHASLERYLNKETVKLL